MVNEKLLIKNEMPLESTFSIPKFLILSFLGLIILNIVLISGYIVIESYGKVTLDPSEKYIINFPFFGEPYVSKSPIICGTALDLENNSPLSGVNVTAYFSSDSSFAGTNTTNNYGEYCITLPEIQSRRAFDINVSYDDLDGTLTLGSNEYELVFNDKKTYFPEERVYFNGSIFNEDAEIENGRLEVIRVSYHDGSGWKTIFNFTEPISYINISSNQIFEFPSSELNISWEIPHNASSGNYSFYWKTSFNANEKYGYFDFFVV